MLDAKHWRERAARAQVHAIEMSEPAVREMMLGIAREYEKLAQRAEAREIGLLPGYRSELNSAGAQNRQHRDKAGRPWQLAELKARH